MAISDRDFKQEAISVLIATRLELQLRIEAIDALLKLNHTAPKAHVNQNPDRK
jgi:hypothetical protein